MRVLFYKGPGTIFDKLIRLWTRSPYSHCELLFSNDERFRVNLGIPAEFYKPRLSPDAPWDRDWWDCIEVPDADENAIRQFCLEEAGSKYDWTGIVFTQVLPWGWQSKTKWFCSENCVAALQKGGNQKVKDLRPAAYSPGAFARFLFSKGYKLI